MNKQSGRDIANPARLAASPSSRSYTIDLYDVIRALRRHIFLIGFIALFCGAAAYYNLSRITPLYTAYAQLLLGEQSLSDQSSFDLVEAQALSNSVIEGEIAIMRSSELLVRVAERLELHKDPEFNPRLRPPAEPNPVMEAVDGLIDWAKALLRPAPTPAPAASTAGAEGEAGTAPADAPAVNENMVRAARANEESVGEFGPAISSVKRGLFIRQQGNSFILSVRFTTEDPQKAAAVANTVMDEYINLLVDKRFAAAQRFTRWLSGRVDELAATLEASERDALAFLAKMEADADSNLRLEQQMKEFTSKLVNARANLAEAKARASRAREIWEKEGALATTNVLTNEAIESFRRTLSQLQNEEAEVRRGFAGDSVQVDGIRRAIEKVEGQIAVEAGNLLQQLDNTVEILSINVAALEGSLRDLEDVNLERSTELIRLNQLERIADANRKVYEDFLGRYKETTEIQNLQNSDAEVMSYATPPGAPSYPRKTTTTVLALFAGLSLGSALALMIEMRTKPLSGTGDVSRQTGLTVFGTLPRLPRRNSLKRILRDRALQPGMPMSSAASVLGNNVTLRGDGGSQTVYVTSYTSNREKCYTAAMLAWSAGTTGKRCLLIDGDTRTATLTRELGITPQRSLLLELIYDQIGFDDAIVEGAHPNFDFIGTRKSDADPAVLFNTARVESLAESLSKIYDLIIIDAPALESIAETNTNAALLKTGIFVVPDRKAKPTDIEDPLSLFTAMGFTDIGVVVAGQRARNVS